MAGNGSVGAVGVGATVQNAARYAAMHCCPEPSGLQQGAQPGAQQRAQHAPMHAPPHAGQRAQHHGAGAHAHPHAHPHAHHAHCAPHGRAVVIGGGAHAYVTNARPIDPATMALTAALVESAAQPEAPSPLRQLGALLTNGLARLAALVELLPGRGDAQPATAPGAAFDVAAPAAPVFSALPALPLQPPPPPLTLTFDPVLGTIVELPEEAPGFAAPGTAPGDGTGVSAGDEDRRWWAPSSWVPIPGFFSRRSRDERSGSIVDRIGALLDETGVSRLQLLALTLLVPIATAFLIRVVVELAGGG